jgi:hypothetical protein
MKDTFHMFRDVASIWSVAYRNGYNDALMKAEQVVADLAKEHRNFSDYTVAEALDVASLRIGMLVKDSKP